MADSGVDQLLDRVDVSQRLAFEFGTELQLEIDGVDSRLKSQVVGMEAGRYLIVKTPTMSQLGGITVKLFAGNRVVVRYVYRGAVYGFETSIVESVSSPFRLLFLNYPKVVNEQTIRSNARISTKLPAHLGKPGAVTEATVTDISIDGCQIELRSGKGSEPLGLEIGGSVDLTVQLPGVAGGVGVRGTIKNLRKDARIVFVGIGFGDLDDSVRSALRGYIESSILPGV